MLDLVGNPNCWFCHAQAHVVFFFILLIIVIGISGPKKVCVV